MNRWSLSVAAALVVSGPAALAQCPNSIVEPTAAGPFGAYASAVYAPGVPNLRVENLDSSSNRSGETVVVWRQQTAQNVPPGGELFTVWAQRINPDGTDRGAPIAVVTGEFDAAQQVRAVISPNAFPMAATWAARVRCDIDDTGTIIFAWDYVNNFPLAGGGVAPRVRARVRAMDFDSGQMSTVQDVAFDGFIVNQLDVDVAIGPRFNSGSGALFPPQVMACVVYSADLAPNLSGGALPIRSSIRMVNIDVTPAATPGAPPALGTQYAPVTVNTVNLTAYTSSNSWGLQYLPAVEVDGRGRGTVVFGEFNGACYGTPCNGVRIRVRRFQHNPTPTYFNVYPDSTTANPSTDFVLDANGWIGHMLHAPDVAVAVDGRVAIRWVRGPGYGQPRIATFTPGFTTHPIHLASDQAISNVLGFGSNVVGHSLSNEGSLSLIELHNYAGAAWTIALHRVEFDTLAVVASVPRIFQNIPAIPEHVNGQGSSFTTPRFTVANSATGGVEVTARVTDQLVGRAHFDSNSLVVTPQSGGTVLDFDISVPGARNTGTGPDNRYLLILSTASYYGSPFEDTLPDGRHSGTAITVDPLTLYSFDPTINPWIGVFSGSLDSSGCKSFTINGWPSASLPTFYASVMSWGWDPTPYDLRTFSVPELVDTTAGP